MRVTIYHLPNLFSSADAKSYFLFSFIFWLLKVYLFLPPGDDSFEVGPWIQYHFLLKGIPTIYVHHCSINLSQRTQRTCQSHYYFSCILPFSLLILLHNHGHEGKLEIYTHVYTTHTHIKNVSLLLHRHTWKLVKCLWKHMKILPKFSFLQHDGERYQTNRLTRWGLAHRSAIKTEWIRIWCMNLGLIHLLKVPQKVFFFLMSSFFLYFILLFIYLFIFGLFRVAPSTYGSSQARGQIGAAAPGLCHSHNNTRSEPRLWPTPQLMAMLGS